MRYPAIITKEGGAVLAEFPDCPGCQTFADSEVHIAAEAQEALEGWLETHLIDGEAPPRPRHNAPRGKKVLWIEVEPALATRIGLRWAREDADLTQAELAKRVGMSQQAVAKLECPGANPTIETLTKLAEALSMQLHVDFGPSARSGKKASRASDRRSHA